MALTSNQTAGISGGIGVLGLAGSIYGTLEASGYAKQVAASEQAQALLEMQADKQRRSAMEISARRQMLQTVRTAQQSQAMALAAAVNQGGQFSSGLAGGRSAVSSQAATGLSGISQNLQIGEKLFDINENIDTAKIAESQAKAKESEAMGLGSMFGALGKSGSSIANLLSLLPMA